ncbi:MAG: MFS transporter [Ruminococcaceae bacterium]|nr:MFS transporter [Oscillospiraceae bacterium]
MAQPNYTRTRRACYFAYVAAASVFCLPPMLFVTFQETYGIPYTLLGTLVAVNFCTQLGIDLIFSFFSKHFNIKLTVRLMPLLTSLGLVVYALVPMLWPQHAYAGLLVGTVIFSVAAGLGEVLLSPTVAALPSDNPERDMSLLHSLYGWGVVLMVAIGTAFFALFGTQNWAYLILGLAVLPLIASLLFFLSPIPSFEVSHNETKAVAKKRNIGLFLCVICIFLGSAAENTMTNWISGYMEVSLGIPKEFCDIVGLALFAILLGSTRTLYAKWGRNIWRMMFIGMIGATLCYLAVGLVPNAIVALIACVLTGCFTSMLWPGSLILMEEQMPGLGVAAYALMAAGGDLGASIAPQLMGIIVDTVADEAGLVSFVGPLSPEQLGMKTGMLIAAIFPAVGIVWLLIIKRYFKIGKKS